MFNWIYPHDPLDSQQKMPRGYCHICGGELYDYDNLEDELCENCEAMLREEEGEEE